MSDKAIAAVRNPTANSIASALTDYFAIPTHTLLPSGDAAAAPLNVKLSGTNIATVGGTITGIVITVTDVSNRCPTKYMTAMASTRLNRRDGWLGASNQHIKYMVDN